VIINLEAELKRYSLPVRRALHVGAHYGDEDAAYRQLGIEPIYVEANPAVFDILRKACPDRECHSVAIADREGQAKFHVTSFDQSSSLLPLKKHAEIYPHIVERCVIEVPCTTIDALLGERRDRIDLLTMDIQGAELLALRGARQTLPHVMCIMTEVNRAELYAGCGLIGDLDRFLRPFDFQRVQSNFKYHRTWGDAFYVQRRFLADQNVWTRLWRLLARGRRAKSAA